jgi:LacI family transcriptional regulator, galactose operon repressor
MGPAPRPNRRRQPTIRDVARHAGAGVGTVSRVLNGSAAVSEGTRAIEELGRTPAREER